MFLHAKQSTTVAITLVNWLSQSGIDLGSLTQADLDRWFAAGPTTRRQAGDFLRWAIRSRLVDVALTIPAQRRGTAPRLGYPQQQAALGRVLDLGRLKPRDRAAGILVLVFAHILASSMRTRLRATFAHLAARLGTLDELTRRAPVAVIAEVLGYHPSTVVQHAVAAAASYAPYVGYRTPPRTQDVTAPPTGGRSRG